jgi:hypothetical protein
VAALGLGAVLALSPLGAVDPALAQVPPAPTIEKRLSPDPGRPLDETDRGIVFRISVFNPPAGADPVRVRLTDLMDPNVTLAPPAAITGDGGACVYDGLDQFGHAVTCDLIVPAGRSVDFEIEYLVQPSACATGRGWNRIEWEWEWTDKLPPEVGDPVELDFEYVPPEPCSMRIEKRVSPSQARPGDTVTYSIVVTNTGRDYRLYTGPERGWATTVLFDVLPPELEDVEVASATPPFTCQVVPDKPPGVPDPPNDWLPADPGTLVWCSTPRSTVVFEHRRGETVEFEMTARLARGLESCGGGLSNTAGYLFGSTSDVWWTPGQIVDADPVTITPIGIDCRPSPSQQPPPDSGGLGGEQEDLPPTGAPIAPMTALVVALVTTGAAAWVGARRASGPAADPPGRSTEVTAEEAP